jgi:hypothetical protein
VRETLNSSQPSPIAAGRALPFPMGKRQLSHTGRPGRDACLSTKF